MATINEFNFFRFVSDVYTATRTGNFTRNNCGTGYTGSTETYTKIYYSTISQQDADNKAANDSLFNTEGQAYANANGTCTLIPITWTTIFNAEKNVNMETEYLHLQSTGLSFVGESYDVDNQIYKTTWSNYITGAGDDVIVRMQIQNTNIQTIAGNNVKVSINFNEFNFQSNISTFPTFRGSNPRIKITGLVDTVPTSHTENLLTENIVTGLQVFAFDVPYAFDEILYCEFQFDLIATLPNENFDGYSGFVAYTQLKFEKQDQ